MSNNSIQPIHRTFSGATSLDQSGPGDNHNEGVLSILQSEPGSNGNKGVLHIPHKFIYETLIGRRGLTTLQGSSQCILQSQPTTQ